MPSVYSDLYCAVDALDGAELALTVDVQNEVDDPDGLFLDASIDGTAGAMAVPTTLTRQQVEMRVYVDGAAVPELVACSVTRSRGQNLAQWEFTVPIHPTASGYAGAFVGGKVGICKKSISIYGVYETSTGTHLIPLIYDGIADNEGRESSGGALVTYQGVDRGGRFDRETIDLNLPPGHGLPRDRVVRLAASRAGVEAFSLEHSETNMMKEFVLADAPFLGPCQELADVEGRVIQWDRSGDMAWPQFGSGSLVPSPSRWSFQEKHFVLGSVSLGQPGELITEMTVDGDAQVIIEQCGDVTVTTKITTKSLEGPLAPAYKQNSDGSYDANTQPADPSDPITTRIEIIERVERCGILVYDRRRAWEFYNPETARYTWDAVNDEWDPIDDVWTDDNSAGDDPAFWRQIESWRLTEVDETWHYWFQTGYQRYVGPLGGFSQVPGLPDSAGHGSLSYPVGISSFAVNDAGQIIGPFAGVKIGTLARSWRWTAPRAAVKTRSIVAYPYDPWEEVEPTSGQKVLGSKEAINTLGTIPGWLSASYSSGDEPPDGEQFLPVSQEAVIYEPDARGYLRSEIRYKFSYFARGGASYLYGDGSEHSEEYETLRYVGSDLTTYVPNGDQQHDEIELETDLDNRTVRSVATIGMDGYLPSAERIPNSGPPESGDEYADAEEQSELYRKAYRTESQPISVVVAAEDLENCSTRGVHRLSAPWVESEDEAEWLGQWIIDEAASAEFRGTLAGANFFIEPGDWCSQVRYHQLGVDSEGRVEDVKWSWRSGQPINTEILVRLYAW